MKNVKVVLWFFKLEGIQNRFKYLYEFIDFDVIHFFSFANWLPCKSGPLPRLLKNTFFCMGSMCIADSAKWVASWDTSFFAFYQVCTCIWRILHHGLSKTYKASKSQSELFWCCRKDPRELCSYQYNVVLSRSWLFLQDWSYSKLLVLAVSQWSDYLFQKRNVRHCKLWGQCTYLSCQKLKDNVCIFLKFGKLHSWCLRKLLHECKGSTISSNLTPSIILDKGMSYLTLSVFELCRKFLGSFFLWCLSSSKVCISIQHMFF